MTAEQERWNRVMKAIEVFVKQIGAIAMEAGVGEQPKSNDAYDLKFSEQGREREKRGT